ncbi:hypothetical protein F3N42_03750 [Marinihelvus fidelis]|uniref:MarR family transcriptional regulator n=1 Tax=Marinihelvus fidelis TaxID=2613842 RepID=A0A5N0THY8_9GAMM|nr:hypothetical protein [Marinihelvus fidelis]KAA9133476.1 hypothetical protein F3N42_03750 [Marinihelvus fidelis]
MTWGAAEAAVPLEPWETVNSMWAAHVEVEVMATLGDEPITTSEIKARTGFPRGSIESALKRCRSADLVKYRAHTGWVLA